MDSLYILIPIALVFSGIAIKAFFWAVDNKQYDDLDAAGYSILFDEDIKTITNHNNEKNTPIDDNSKGEQ